MTTITLLNFVLFQRVQVHFDAKTRLVRNLNVSVSLLDVGFDQDVPQGIFCPVQLNHGHTVEHSSREGVQVSDDVHGGCKIGIRCEQPSAHPRFEKLFHEAENFQKMQAHSFIGMT